MMERICFLFGHADAPDHIYEHIKNAVDTCYADGIRAFLVGRYGGFDRMALRAVSECRQRNHDIKLLLLCPYALTMKPSDIPAAVDEVIAPPLDGVPGRARIVAANRYAVDLADTVICYVTRIGNSRELLDYAMMRRKTRIGIAAKNS